MEKYIYYNGLKFTRDDRTGYYLNSTIRKRLHRYIWEYHNGEIPKGYQIHHIDHDKSNNDISNLSLTSGKAHRSYHGVHRTITHRQEIVNNLNENARPKAIEWHKSEQGKEWHKEHYEKTKDKFHAKKDYICKYCDKTFLSARQGYCSNKCRSAYRRLHKIDNVDRKCVWCGEVFNVNKYSKQRFCTRSCGRLYVHKNK